MADRLETGVVQAPDDWPGVFFRGDDALRFAGHLDALLRAAKARDWNPISVSVVEGLSDTLRSCNTIELDPRDVTGIQRTKDSST